MSNGPGSDRLSVCGGKSLRPQSLRRSDRNRSQGFSATFWLSGRQRSERERLDMVSNIKTRSKVLKGLKKDRHTSQVIPDHWNPLIKVKIFQIVQVRLETIDHVSSRKEIQYSKFIADKISANVFNPCVFIFKLILQPLEFLTTIMIFMRLLLHLTPPPELCFFFFFSRNNIVKIKLIVIN